MKSFMRYWFPLIVYMGLIFYVSSIAMEPIIIGEKFQTNNYLHIIEYSLLGILSFRAFKNVKRFEKNLFLIIIIFSTLYGVTDEIHQLFVPGRYFSYSDIFLDFLGSSTILLRRLF